MCFAGCYHLEIQYRLSRTSLILGVALFALIAISAGIFFGGKLKFNARSFSLLPYGEQCPADDVIKNMPAPAGWVTKEYPAYNFSVAAPKGWTVGDLGPMVSGVRLSNPSTNESVSIAYDYTNSDTVEHEVPLKFTNMELKAQAIHDLLGVCDTHIANTPAYRGVFSNPHIGLVQSAIYVERNGTPYYITVSGDPSPSEFTVLQTFSFLK